MDIRKGVKVLGEDNFKVCSIWKFQDETDLYYPIFSSKDFSEHDDEILIGAKFYSPMGMTFNGYLMDGAHVYCIGLFFKGNEFIFNKNLTSRCLKRFKELRELLPSSKTILIPDIFPLKYETVINLEGYKNITGEFDAFEENSNLLA